MSEFKETVETITLHGLGFLQVKLSGNQRINVWHPDLPKRDCFQFSSIHDHRFGFTSRVLVGTQVNQLWRSVPNTPIVDCTHIAYLHEGDRTEFGNRPWIEDFKLKLERAGRDQQVNSGEEYSISPYIYHNTIQKGICVTLMTKTFEGQQGSHSLCVSGVDPDIDFDRKQWSEDDLWEIFRESINLR